MPFDAPPEPRSVRAAREPEADDPFEFIAIGESGEQPVPFDEDAIAAALSDLQRGRRHLPGYRVRSEQIELALSTAYSGFRAAVLESRRTTDPDAQVAIHSGFWGCGAFGGNRVMMTLVQILAADMAGLTRLVLHLGDPSGRTSVERALALARDHATATKTSELVARVEALGLGWGVSDGN